MNDDELWAGFRAPSLTHTEWTHQAHLRIAYLHLAQFEPDEAHLRFRAGIIKLNATHGIDESPARGYHETLTITWLALVAAARVGDAQNGYAAADSAAFCEAHPELFDRHLPLRFYSKERLMGVQARARFVAPDLAPLP